MNSAPASEPDGDVILAIDDEESRAEAVTAGVVLGDALLSALRRLAKESALAS